MLGNFKYHNPTKLYFGKDSLDNLSTELSKYGKKILLIYGKGSIKKIGLYDKVIKICKSLHKEVEEISGVMPNPTFQKIEEGLKIARKFKPDFLLAIGGGSVIDYTKGLSACIYAKGNLWDYFWLKGNEPKASWKLTPLGAILTMVGTGSEMNGGSIITNTKTNRKVGKHFVTTKLFPQFAILDPTLTYSVPYRQMVSGIFDIFAHICEQYFSDYDNNVTDYIAEGLMRCVIDNSKVAIKNPSDYEARSNLMWAATWALNTLLRKGKTEDWNPHKIGQVIGGITDATHGLCLAAIYPTYHNYVMPYNVDKYAAFAINVWRISPSGKTKKQIATAGIKAMVEWMKQLKVNVTLRDLGVTKMMIKPMANLVPIQKGCYRKLTTKDIETILTKSL